MERIAGSLDDAARAAEFSGVVRVDRAGDVQLEQAFGFADRAHRIPNAVTTQFATASATKGLTALTVVRLIERGALDLTTTARSVLGSDLPLIGDGVTVEHLLAHRSGIGDYLDEDGGHEVTDYLMPVSVHELERTEQFLAVLGGQQTVFAPDERFAYNNGGYMVLALIAERVSGTDFHELVLASVCKPAGMPNTAFLRSDQLPGTAARGYLAAHGLQSNVFHLPVRGNGDGGIYSTAADISNLWTAFFAGRIVSPDWVAEMVRPRSEAPRESKRYGLGFWLHESSDVVMLVGYDAGVSFWSMHDPGSGTTRTVISNWTDGAWPIAELLEATE
jgi:CubicO group peptidase (beta-lactamase class C family)